jgi:hypothetical protein
MATKTRNIIMYVAVGAIFVAAAVGVTYAVVMHYKTLGTDDHFSHNENGFMEAWPQWEESNFPLILSTNIYTPDRSRQAIDPGTSRTAIRAAERWNDAVGQELFYVEDWVGPAGGRARIFINIGVPSEEGWMDPGGTAVIITESDGWQHCLIETSNSGSSEILFYVIMHELGHCLGLAHDTWEGSIMRRTQGSAADLRDAPRISDHDTALLRNRYELE